MDTHTHKGAGRERSKRMKGEVKKGGVKAKAGERMGEGLREREGEGRGPKSLKSERRARTHVIRGGW